jgi:hypothetical protein
VPQATHLHLLPTLTADDLVQAAREEHPSVQLLTADEMVFEWHGLVEHGAGETPCCHQRIEVTNLVDDQHRVAEDVVAMLSTVLHGWAGYDVMVLVTISPPALHRQ